MKTRAEMLLNKNIKLLLLGNFALKVLFSVIFVLVFMQGQTQSFSANLLPNQTFNRPTPGAIVCGAPTFGTFKTVSAGGNVYSYATQSFTVSTAGYVIIEVPLSPSVNDPMLMVYSLFDPFMPTRDFIIGDDDSGTGTLPRIACQNFFFPGTYTLVVTTYSAGPITGVVNFNISGVDPVVILPTVTTSTASSVTSSSAVIGGAVTDDGGAGVTERGVAWGTENNPTTGTIMGSGLGPFEEEITGLTPGSTYYHRAYATNSVGTAYGPQLSFTTLSAPLDPTSISATDIDICEGGSVELTALGAEGEVYWYTGGCGAGLIGIGNSITVSPTETTTYYARNFNNDLFSTGCASIEISIVEQPTPIAISRLPDIDNICAGQIISINAISGEGGGGIAIDQYSFSTNGGVTWSELSVDLPSFEAEIGSNLIRGLRTTTAAGCNNSETVMVSWEAFMQPSAPAITRIPNNDVVCNNTLLRVEHNPGTGGIGTIQDQFRYSTDNGINWSLWSDEVPEFIGIEGINIIQSRRLADGEGCDIAEEQVSWVVLPEILPPVVSQSQTICWNSNPQPLTATEASGGNNSGYLYLWQSSQDGENWTDITGETSLILDPGPLETTTHFRVLTTETDFPNCAEGIFSNIVTIEVVSKVNPGSISILNDEPSTICHNTWAPIIFGTEEYITNYIWEYSTTGPNIGFEIHNYHIGPWFVPEVLSQTTWYRRTATIVSNDVICYSEPSNTIEITVQEPVTPGEIAGSQEICHGAIPDPILSQVDGSGSEPVTYIWQSSTTSANDGFTMIPDETAEDYAPLALTQTTWFRRIAVSTLNEVACQSQPTDAVEIFVFNSIELTAAVSNQITCRDDVNGEITLVASGGFGSFEFSIDGLNYITENVFDGLPSGDYAFYVRDEEGCQTTTHLTLENPETLTLIVDQTRPIRCKGESNAEVTLSGDGGWGDLTFSSDGILYNSTTVLENLGPGAYIFYISDSEGCITSQTIEIEEPEEEFNVEIISVQNVNCFNETNGQATVAGLNGWNGYSYLWNTLPVQTTPAATGLAAGNYLVEVQDINGCTVQLDVEISQPEPLIIANNVIEDVYCRNEAAGGLIVIEVTGGIGNYNYSWFDQSNTPIGENSESIEGVAQGTYSVIISDFNGCILDQNFIVGYDDEDCIVRIPQGFSPNSDGKNDVWEVRNLLYMHPDNRVKIFNRHGTLVFEAEKYDDDWDGTPNRGNVLIGKNGKVPAGVYFYMIWLDSNSSPISGSLFIAY